MGVCNSAVEDMLVAVLHTGKEQLLMLTWHIPSLGAAAAASSAAA
jgi:hypothetical protein